jgi:hypothetical protein
MEENSNSQPSYNPRDFYTPLEEAISEIKKRREDPTLMQKVREYLDGDIPSHFDREQPILYMARHIATPNYEAMRFVELGKPHGLPLVIGQDRKGKFVSHNELKRSLGKLPVTKGISRRQDEIVENFTVVDFACEQGKPFCEITTKHGKNLVDFHNSFFQHIYPTEIEIADESDWIDRNHREDLKEHYKKSFALLCAHGIMLEYFTDDESLLAQQAFGPALAEVQETIGVKPLIMEMVTQDHINTRNWNGYPSILYQFIKRDIEGDICE